MLTTLRIKNLALVADLTLELGPGLNIITGETGAGKSILIGGLNLVLGERADRTAIRAGTESCVVEAVFELGKLRATINLWLEANGLEPCEGSELLLKRTFAVSGTNRQFVNGSPASLGLLASLGEWLVDIHGPHDHQSLLHPSRQLEILDAFGNLQELRNEFGVVSRQRAELEREKIALVVDERTYAQQLDLLRFQVREIESARLREDEEPQVEADHQRASNAARLLELGQQAASALSGEDTGMLSHAGAVGRALADLARIDPGAGHLTELHATIATACQELQTELTHYLDKVEIDPGRLHELEERLNLLQSLKRKYGRTVAEVIQFGEEAARKLGVLEKRDAELERLNAALTENAAELRRRGAALSTARRGLLPRLNKAVVKHLRDLGFAQSQFEARLESASGAGREPGPAGYDTIEFQFAPNPGEPPRPLRAIASSGELARVMLALKTVLAAVDAVPVLVFDEVDANVGGETGVAVGQKMRQIARERQVICITHLAQVAAHANAHYVVSKGNRAGRTVSEITRLDGADRVDEVARMLGGQSEPARKHAEALLASARQ